MRLPKNSAKSLMASASRSNTVLPSDCGRRFFSPTKTVLWNSGLNTVAEIYNKPIIFSTHPRTAKRIEKEKIKFNPLIKNLKPLGFFDYVKLQKNAYCVLSDSGTIPEECAILNFPGVSIRTSTERPEALDAGSVVLGGITPKDMINSIELAVNSYREGKENPVRDYKDTNVSEKVVKIIQSYYNIINSRIWRK